MLNALNIFVISATTWTILAPFALAAAVYLAFNKFVMQVLYVPLFAEVAISIVELLTLTRALQILRF